MYRVAVLRQFVARHYLIGGDFGAENDLHSHHYRLHVVLEAPRLDEHGFVFDISLIEERLDEIVSYLGESTLNDLEEFQHLNPSVEHVARVCAEAVAPRCAGSNVTRVTARVWEHEQAWAECEVEVR